MWVCWGASVAERVAGLVLCILGSSWLFVFSWFMVFKSVSCRFLLKAADFSGFCAVENQHVSFLPQSQFVFGDDFVYASSEVVVDHAGYVDFVVAVVFQGLGGHGLQKHASFQKRPCALRQNVPQNNNRLFPLQPQTPTGNIERVSYKNYFWGEGFCGGVVILEG